MGVCAPAVWVYGARLMYVNIPYVCTLHGRCEHIWSQIDGGKEGYAPVISLLYMCVWTPIVEHNVKSYCLLSYTSTKDRYNE